jgi:hypothetical protein
MSAEILRIKDKAVFISNFMSQDDINTAIDYIKSVEKWTLYHTEMFCLDYEVNPKVADILNSAALVGINEYMDMVGHNISDYVMNDIHVIHEWQLNKELPPHDDVTKYNPLDGPRCDTTVLLYLGDDYEGGEINLIDLDISIKPKNGSVLVFDSRLLHSVSPTTSGMRLVVDTPMFFASREDLGELVKPGIPAADKFR